MTDWGEKSDEESGLKASKQEVEKAKDEYFAIFISQSLNPFKERAQCHQPLATVKVDGGRA